MIINSNRFMFTLLCAMAILPVNAYTLHGMITNAEKVPVEFATIRISTMDTVFLKGATADERGAYEIKDLPNEATLLVNVSCVGHETWTGKIEPVTGEKVALDVILKPNLSISELEVVAKQFVRTKDGLTIHPSKQQVKHSGTGYDLLRSLMIPGVSVNTSTGTVSALGAQFHFT